MIQFNKNNTIFALELLEHTLIQIYEKSIITNHTRYRKCIVYGE